MVDARGLGWAGALERGDRGAAGFWVAQHQSGRVEASLAISGRPNGPASHHRDTDREEVAPGTAPAFGPGPRALFVELVTGPRMELQHSHLSTGCVFSSETLCYRRYVHVVQTADGCELRANYGWGELSGEPAGHVQIQQAASLPTCHRPRSGGSPLRLLLLQPMDATNHIARQAYLR